MTRAPHRIVLLTAPRAPAPGGSVRRYRIARLKLAERHALPAPRLAQLARMGD